MAADYAEQYSTRSEDRIQNLLRLGEALHRVGTPAHQLEEALTSLAVRLQIRAQFFSSPTALFARIDSETHAQTHLLRVQPGNVDLEKLCQLDELMQSLADNEISLSEVTPQLDAIENAPPRYGWKMNLFAFSVTSAAATCFFGGTARDFLAAGVLGLLVGLILRVAQLKHRVGLMVYPIAGIVVAFLSHVAAMQFQTTVYVVSLSSLVVLLPGLSLTLAISELATQNLLAGTTRLTGAF
ncbi:MAG: threonine/serine exporter family protein, partial [Candidatus Eisenbacteria bacterium]|nr:threonine/serine exporter family protein [Candidatus Eisenbacteria bacterium]